MSYASSQFATLARQDIQATAQQFRQTVPPSRLDFVRYDGVAKVTISRELDNRLAARIEMAIRDAIEAHEMELRGQTDLQTGAGQ